MFPTSASLSPRYPLLLFLVLLVHLTRQTEIDDLHLALGVHEDVRGLEVAMHEITALAVSSSRHRIPAYTANRRATDRESTSRTTRSSPTLFATNGPPCLDRAHHTPMIIVMQW